MSNKKKELTYFLDHPQITRHKSPGNGKSPTQNYWDKLKSRKSDRYQACKQKYSDMEHGAYKSMNIVKCTKNSKKKK